MERLFIYNHPANETSYASTSVGHVETLQRNTKKHWRKFMEKRGQFLENGIIKQADLYF